MIIQRRIHRTREGAAAVEFAVCLPFLLIMILGVWEVGRMVEVRQLMQTAVREGGRQASTANISPAEVQTYVVNYLKTNGITSVNLSDVVVENITDSTRSDPRQALQLDRLRITLTVDFDSTRWIILSSITGTTTLTATADWYSMADVPITVNTVIPTN
jgi:Flp pilus assembly protein TadG